MGGGGVGLRMKEMNGKVTLKEVKTDRRKGGEGGSK